MSSGDRQVYAPQSDEIIGIPWTMQVGSPRCRGLMSGSEKVPTLWTQQGTPLRRSQKDPSIPMRLSLLRFGQPYKGPIIPFGSLVEYHPITAKDQSRIHQFGKKSYLDCSSGTHCTRVEFGRVTYWLQTLRSLRRWTHLKSTQKDLMRKR